jgi:uncharacterized membrane protein YhhN
LDVAYWVVAVLHIVGDILSVPGSFSFWTIIELLRPVPLWILIYQLWNLQRIHRSVEKIVIGLAVISLGSILLIINKFAQRGDSPTFYFAIAGIFFIIGYLLYSISFIEAGTDSSSSSFNLQSTMTQKAGYILIWVVLVGFTFFSLSHIVGGLPAGSWLVWELAIYFAFILLLVMAALYYYFTAHKVDALLNFASLLAVFGSLLTLVSDTLMVHYNLNNSWHTVIACVFYLVTFYLAEFLIGKSAIKTAAFFHKVTV